MKDVNFPVPFERERPKRIELEEYNCTGKLEHLSHFLSLSVLSILEYFRECFVTTDVGGLCVHSGGVPQANIYCGTAPDSQMLLVQLMMGKRGKTG